jgi:beta-lactamase superfamily II metal-dependent hydrolase
VLWPPAGLDPQTWRPNDRALVLRLRAGGYRVLIPGDIERDALRALLAAHAAGTLSLAADVLVAPHHGSVAGPATAAFLAAVDPELIVVSAAEPRPALRALVARTLGPDRPVLVTGEVGAVTLRLAGPGALYVETPFAPQAVGDSARRRATPKGR